MVDRVLETRDEAPQLQANDNAADRCRHTTDACGLTPSACHQSPRTLERSDVRLHQMQALIGCLAEVVHRRMKFHHLPRHFLLASKRLIDSFAGAVNTFVQTLNHRQHVADGGSAAVCGLLDCLLSWSHDIISIAHPHYLRNGWCQQRRIYMSENIDVIVWRANQADMSGDVFTPEALKQMADGLIPGALIMLNYEMGKIVGTIVQAYIDGDDLRTIVQVDEPLIAKGLHDETLAIRPGFQITASSQPSRDCRVIEKIGVVHISVLSSPMPLPGDKLDA